MILISFSFAVSGILRQSPPAVAGDSKGADKAAGNLCRVEGQNKQVAVTCERSPPTKPSSGDRVSAGSSVLTAREERLAALRKSAQADIGASSLV